MKFIKFRDHTGEYRWRLVSNNNETLCTSEGYVRRADRNHSLRLVRGLRTIFINVEDRDSGPQGGWLK